MKSPDVILLALQKARNQLVEYELLTNPQYKPNWHHELIAKELEHIEKYGDRDYKILVVTVPPRHGKSQQCTIDFSSWYLGRNPEKEVIVASYSAELAQDFGSKTRDKVNSLEYKLIFPEVKLKEDEQARGRWRTSKGGGLVAVGVGGPITGRGAHLLNIDDPIKNREEANSEVYRKKVWEWFTSTAFTRLHPGGVVVITVTRWHVGDLVGLILENQDLAKRTKILRFPAIANKDGKNRKVGEPLWPDRYDARALAEIKSTIGPYDWSSLYQCSPILTADQKFKPEWYKYIEQQELDSKQTANYLTIDTAMSKKTQADHCGFCDNSVDKENFWNFKAWRAKLSPEELVDNLFSLHVKRRYSAIGIEKTTYTWGLKPFIDEEQRKRNIFLPIVELKHNSTAKQERIEGLIPRYAAGSIRHIVGACSALEEELMNFPNGIKDDVSDAASYQNQLVTLPKKSVNIYRKKTRNSVSDDD